MVRLGLLGPPALVPYASIKGTEDPWKSEKHKAVARLVTQESIVLLKNDNHFLPLSKEGVKSIAVIGPHADKVLLDCYSGTPPYSISLLAGIKDKVGERVRVQYAANNDFDAAVKIAKTSDVAIVIIGNHPTYGAGCDQCPIPSDGKEAIDRKSINLEQEELAKQVYAVNPHTVAVLIASFPFAINWTKANLSAILHMTHNSEEEGNALADVLFGDYNPGGRLVHTWPLSMDQLPEMMDYNIRHGRTYMYFKGEPLFPFGFGLSYTTFAYSNLRTSSTHVSGDGAVAVSVDVTNTGAIAGDEVVQIYVKHLESKVERPIQELKGFKRLHVLPNQTKTVQFHLKAVDLTYWDEASHRFVVEKGKFKILVGRSSAEIKMQKTLESAP